VCCSLSLLVKRYERIRMEMRRKKIITSHVPPFKVTPGHRGTDTDRYDFLLVIHSNHGPILHRFQDSERYAKFRTFYWRVYFDDPAEGVFLGIF